MDARCLVEMTRSVVSKKDFGYCEMFIFIHQNYFLAHEDKFVSHLYEDYKNAFVSFVVYKN